MTALYPLASPGGSPQSGASGGFSDRRLDRNGRDKTMRQHTWGEWDPRLSRGGVLPLGGRRLWGILGPVDVDTREEGVCRTWGQT